MALLESEPQDVAVGRARASVTELARLGDEGRAAQCEGPLDPGREQRSLGALAAMLGERRGEAEVRSGRIDPDRRRGRGLVAVPCEERRPAGAAGNRGEPCRGRVREPVPRDDHRRPRRGVVVRHLGEGERRPDGRRGERLALEQHPAPPLLEPASLEETVERRVGRRRDADVERRVAHGSERLVELGRGDRAFDAEPDHAVQHRRVGSVRRSEARGSGDVDRVRAVHRAVRREGDSLELVHGASLRFAARLYAAGSLAGTASSRLRQ